MTNVVMVANKSNANKDSIEVFYTSPVDGGGTSILAFTASNNNTNSSAYSVYIYDLSGSLVSAIIPFQIVPKDLQDYAPGTIGHLIPAGGTLRMSDSTAGNNNYYVTGDEL